MGSYYRATCIDRKGRAIRQVTHAHSISSARRSILNRRNVVSIVSIVNTSTDKE